MLYKKGFKRREYDNDRYDYFEKFIVIEKIYFKTVYNVYFLWYNVIGENWETRLCFRRADYNMPIKKHKNSGEYTK